MKVGDYVRTKDYIHDDIWLIYSMNSIGLTEREVEIIEEHKIPKKLKLYKLSDNDSANISTLQDFNNRNIQITINEIIDYLEEIE